MLQPEIDVLGSFLPPSHTGELLMIPGMSQQEAISFAQRIGATVIANQAILKCSAAGLPLTTDNVILFVGDFVNPENEALQGFIDKIQTAIEEVVNCFNPNVVSLRQKPRS